MATVAAASSSCALAAQKQRIRSFNGLSSKASSLTCHVSPSLPRLSSGARVQCSVAAETTTWLLAAAGDVSSEGNTYLIVGAIAVALIGTAFPILFSRKDMCPVCDGSGFVRSGAKLAGNAGRKDDERIVCQNCKGLGKINQVDK